LGDFLKKVPQPPQKLSLNGFMKTDGEVRALSVYAELRGISDRLILSLAPAAILVPPPKMAFTFVLGGEKNQRVINYRVILSEDCPRFR